MDTSEELPYLTVLNDGIHNFLLDSTAEALDGQDSNLKEDSIFTEIEDAAKEWTVGLPVLMDDQDIQEPCIGSPSGNAIESTMELTSDLPEIYEESLTSACDMVFETVSNEENEAESEITYPIEVPGKGFLTSEGLFITNDLLLQLSFGNNEELSTKNVNSSEQAVLPPPRPIINNQSLLISKQLPPGSLINKQASLNNVCSSTNITSSNPSLINVKNIERKQLVKNNDWFEVVSVYKCKRCGFLSEERDFIIQHYRVNHSNEVAKNEEERCNKKVDAKSIIRNGKSQTIYICSICKLGYGSTEKLKLHMILSHKLTYIPAELQVKPSINTQSKSDNGCKSIIKQEERKKIQMSILRQQTKAAKKLKCSVTGCELRFALDDMRARHERCHVEGQKQFKCLECGLKFSLWRMCSLHLWRCHSLDLGLLTCPMCNSFKASSTVRLMNHMAIHEEDRPYICLVCDKGFKQHSQLINHRIVHRDSDILPGWASQQQCDICKKYFSNSKSLKKHVQSVHDKFKPFICSVCGHKTARKSMLELHLRQHTGEKPHQCSFCLYKTGDHNSLRRHLMRHSGHTKYSCPHCKYQSIQSTAYKNHVATRHPGLGGSFYCTLCSYHTVNENTYTAHLGDHEKGLIKEVADKNGVGGKIYISLTSAMAYKKNFLDQRNKGVTNDTEDDESHNYLSLLEHSNDAVDTGGITIPAGFEIPE